MMINDSYNANPRSVSADLRILAQHKGGKRIAMLGDMKELGVAPPPRPPGGGGRGGGLGLQVSRGGGAPGAGVLWARGGAARALPRRAVV